MTDHSFAASRQSLEEFVGAWETCTLPQNQWTHAAHVAMCAYYTARYRDGVFERMRSGIIQYNQAVGIVNSDTSGYHETLTRLWVNVIATIVDGLNDPFQAVYDAGEKVGQERNLHRSYYSFDVVNSAEARRAWIPPDLQGPY